MPDPSLAVIAALKTLVDYVDGLETRVRHLQVTTAAIAGQHLRDEDVVPDRLEVGDIVRVEWFELGGADPLAQVRDIQVEADGTKTVIVGPIEVADHG